MFKRNVECNILSDFVQIFLRYLEMISSTIFNIFNTLLSVNILKWIFVKAHLYLLQQHLKKALCTTLSWKIISLYFFQFLYKCYKEYSFWQNKPSCNVSTAQLKSLFLKKVKKTRSSFQYIYFCSMDARYSLLTDLLSVISWILSSECRHCVYLK